jgi:protein translocase SecG subunit
VKEVAFLIFIVKFLHVTSCLGLIVVTLLTASKSETTGGMMGALGGKVSSAMNLPVGIDRFLQPLTIIFATGFIATAILNALGSNMKWLHFVVVMGLYVLVLTYGKRIVELYREMTEEKGK